MSVYVNLEITVLKSRVLL